MTDEQRRRDILLHARHAGLSTMVADAGFREIVQAGPLSGQAAAERVPEMVRRFGEHFRCDEYGQRVAAILDIYYMRYHSIMQLIEQGQGQRLSQELLGQAGRLLIEPMPGYDIFVPLIKGWLGEEDADGLYDLLRAPLAAAHPGEREIGRPGLRTLARHFAGNPVKLALVTASIAFETHATMREICRVMTLRVGDWPVSQACKERVMSGLADYEAVFDAFINASDACEHRLKPHRDLYSLALARMAVPKQDYSACVGLEDTEPGIISLRAAGIGCAVALPNHDTSRQDFQAAAAVVHHGLPELILVHNCFLKRSEAVA